MILIKDWSEFRFGSKGTGLWTGLDNLRALHFNLSINTFFLVLFTFFLLMRIDGLTDWLRFSKMTSVDHTMPRYGYKLINHGNGAL